VEGLDLKDDIDGQRRSPRRWTWSCRHQPRRPYRRAVGAEVWFLRGCSGLATVGTAEYPASTARLLPEKFGDWDA